MGKRGAPNGILSAAVILGALSALGAIVWSCAPAVPDKSYVKECILPTDQLGTLSARWGSLPVPVAFHANEFSSDEMSAITHAADTWNEFFQATQGISVIDYGDANNPRQLPTNKPSVLCGQGIVSSNGYTGSVTIYKQGRWPYSNKDAIALTSFCPMAAKPFPTMYMGIMEVNYEDFFVEGRKQPDLTSIFVHEFGHLIGLDHSCDTKSRSGFPNCNDSAMPDDYFQAVMFPVVLFDDQGYGEPRRLLQSNDEGRANCLYEDMASK
jgi:hypothetical protein